MSDDTPNLGLPFLVEAQADRETTVNESLIRLDSLAQLSVVSRSVSAPPSAPSEGQRWIIPASGATGAWVGRGKQVAAWYAGWKFFTPQPGWVAYAADENKLIRFKDGLWDLVSSGETLDSVGDVEVPSPSDGDRLYYDATTSRWRNISGNLGSLKNVDAAAPSDGDRLSWDAAASKWKSISGRLRALFDVDAAAPNDGDRLAWDAATSKWKSIAGRLRNLLDVDAAAPSNGDRLAWDSASSTWKSVGGRLRNLIDVDAASPAGGQVLTWDSASSTWKPATPAAGGGSSGPTMTKPTVSMFTQVSVGSSIFTDQTDHLYCEIEGNGSGWITRFLARPAPSARYRITVCLDQPIVSTPYFGAGIFLRHSGDNRAETMALQARRDDAPNYMTTLSCFRWTSLTALTVLTERNLNTNTRIWIRVSVTATQRITEVSRDGVNWSGLYSVGISEFFTPNAPNQVGIGFPTASIAGHDGRCIYRIYHYAEEILP